MGKITEWKPKIVIVDMDDVMAGYKTKFCEIWNALNPAHKIDYNALTSPKLEDLFESEADKRKLRLLLTQENFFLSLPVIDGAKEALEEMVEMKHTVNICTQPLLYVAGQKVGYDHCEAEKRRWIREHLGTEWHDKMITTPDKTRVIADYLIDDNPKIGGEIKPSPWVQIIFDQPYNRVDKRGNPIAGPRIRSWLSWKEDVPELVPPGYKK